MEEKRITQITEKDFKDIIDNSVQNTKVRLVGNPAEVKKAYVKPIANVDGTPNILSLLQKVVREANEALGTIPLVPNRPIYVNRTYEQIREDIRLGAENDEYWSSLDETYYAFMGYDFNRKAVVGDKFGVTCSSLDGYIFNLSAQVTEIDEARDFVYFKILDEGNNEQDDLVLLFDPRKVALVIDEVIDLTRAGTTHEEIVVGYTNSIDSASLNKSPAIGERSIAFLKTADNYIYSVLIEITDKVNDDGFYPFKVVEVMLLNEGPIPFVCEALLEFNDKDYNYLFNKFKAGTELETNGAKSEWFSRPPKINDRFCGVGITSDKRNVGFTAIVTRVANENGTEYLWFKFADLVLLGEDYPMLHRTMAFSGVTAEEFTATDSNGNYTFKGYDGHHSIGTELFSVPPRPGNHFFGTTLLIKNNNDPYPIVATFTAVVTSITNGKVDYKLVDATIIHDPTKIDEQIALKIGELVAGADESFDTLKEIADWIKEHPESVAQINVAIQENAEKIQTNETAIKSLETQTQQLTAEIPLIPHRPIYINKAYAEIRADIEENETDEQWISEGDYYAFWYTDFNRTARVGDKFGVTCSSIDGYIFNISAVVTRVIFEGRVYFKIIDKDPQGEDDFVLLHDPNDIPLVVDEVLVLPSSHESIVPGYKNSIDLPSLSRIPKKDDSFWGICKTTDGYVYSFVANCTGEFDKNAAGLEFAVFEFKEVWLLYDSSFGYLSEYVKRTDWATDDVGGVLRGVSTFGFKVDAYGRGNIIKAENTDIDAKSSAYKPIVPINGDYFLRKSITTNTETLTDEEKASACNWLGALQKKNDIFPTESGYYVYAIDRNGNNILLGANYYAGAGLAVRSSMGAIIVPNTTDTSYEGFAVNKKYVNDNFVAKPTDTSGYNRVIGVDTENNPLTYSLQYPNYRFSAAGASSRNGIPAYTNGNLGCSIPTSDYHTANKKYVDNLPDHLTLTEEEKSAWRELIGIGGGSTLYLHTITSESMPTYKLFLTTTFAENIPSDTALYAIVRDSKHTILSISDNTNYPFISITIDPVNSMYGLKKVYLNDELQVTVGGVIQGVFTDTVTEL